jgi:MFS family permease
VPRNRPDLLALLAALGADNLGSGMFLPIVLVFATSTAGVPLTVAGPVITGGTAAGLLVPPLAGPLVDRIGPRRVVIAAQLVQAGGAGAFLFAHGIYLVVVGALLLAAGQQLFYSSLMALISDVAADGPKDRPFAVVGMIRSGCFGLGGLIMGVLLAVAGPNGPRIAVGADALSFLLCAGVLALFVHIRHTAPAEPDPVEPATKSRVWTDGRLLTLMAATAAVALATDFLLSGVSVYVINQLRAQPWLPGAMITVCTVVTSLGGTVALRLTARLSRPAGMALGGVLVVLWCVASTAALALPAQWRPPELCAATALLAVGELLFGPRANAIAVDLAPASVRGRYLALFQYSYTVPGVLAPAIVALFAVAGWLPWLVVAVGAGSASIAFLALASRLPARVVRPDRLTAPPR